MQPAKELGARRRRWTMLLPLVAVLVGQVAAGLSAASADGGPTVTTGKADYAPGETVDMYGSGFEADSSYVVVVVRPDGSAALYAEDGSGPSCLDESAADGTACSQAVTSDASGAWTNAYVLNGIVGEYRIEVYPAAYPGDTTLIASGTFLDAPQFKLLGADGLEHLSRAAEENLGSVVQGTSLVISCFAGSGLKAKASGLSPSQGFGWTIEYFGGTVQADNALLAPITTFDPASGTFTKAVPDWCITTTIDTSGLAPGTYEGILKLLIDHPLLTGPRYFFEFTVLPRPGRPLQVSKTADPRGQFGWTIAKRADRTEIRQVDGSAEVTYTVEVGRVAGTWRVAGEISVVNPNNYDVSAVSVTDAIDDPAATCVVDGGSSLTIPAGSSVTVPYTCTYSARPASGPRTNTATVTWPATGNPAAGGLASGSATATAPVVFDAANVVDECVTVTDTFGGVTETLGQVCDGSDPEVRSFTYARRIPVQPGCLLHPNTAAFRTNDSGAAGLAGATVRICGAARTGARTMGFWQNRNGQDIVATDRSTSGVCNLTAWLRQYAPFRDLSSGASCSRTASYVLNVIRDAESSGDAMNKMLKAQALATALDVYFSDPALGGNRIAAPGPIGGVRVDLTLICHKADERSCTLGFQDARAAFGGASSLTVAQMLAHAASQSNSGGTTWYGNVKSVQELAKDAFDAVNNDAVFRP